MKESTKTYDKTGSEDENEMFPCKKKQLEKKVIFSPYLQL